MDGRRPEQPGHCGGCGPGSSGTATEDQGQSGLATVQALLAASLATAAMVPQPGKKKERTKPSAAAKCPEEKNPEQDKPLESDKTSKDSLTLAGKDKPTEVSPPEHGLPPPDKSQASEDKASEQTSEAPRPENSENEPLQLSERDKFFQQSGTPSITDEAVKLTDSYNAKKDEMSGQPQVPTFSGASMCPTSKVGSWSLQYRDRPSFPTSPVYSGYSLSWRGVPNSSDAASLTRSLQLSGTDSFGRPNTNWCLSCPPNSLGFSAARHAKKDVPQTKPDCRDYIGFATLPEQVHRKSVKRGFDFTLLVVGDAGLGKSTLINSLFLGDLYKDRRIPDVGERVEKTTQIEKKAMDIEERGVKLRLTIVDTPGFGDAVNCEESWRACVNYVDEQFRQYFTDENGLNRRNLQDNRVHCCLYFIPPFGHGLRQIDVEFMKRLHRKVNIVPIIGKADTLTAAEVVKLKRQILADIEENKVQIYQFPECDSDEDEDFKTQDRELKACIPFAVVGSNTVLEVGGKKVRGRQYPWGVVEVENPKHSDFNKLRNMLITTHMQDLKDVTEDVHYENFRAQCISQISQQAIRERGSVGDTSPWLLQPLQAANLVQTGSDSNRPERKLKRDSGVPLDPSTISETDRLLLQKDEEIRRMQDMLTQMQEQLKQTGNKRDSIVNV